MKKKHGNSASNPEFRGNPENFIHASLKCSLTKKCFFLQKRNKNIDITVLALVLLNQDIFFLKTL